MARRKKRYGKYGKSTTLVYTLMAAALLELVLLACMAAWTVQEPSSGVYAGGKAPLEEEEEILPDEEAQPDDAAELLAVLQPEPVKEREKPADEQDGWELLTGTQLLAHGMGELEGVTILNCLEAFQRQYERGVRAFEVDLRLTADLQVVLRHDWRAGWQDGISEASVPTLEEFLARPVLEQYTPMSFQDLLLLMEQYPDICIITDSKFVDAEVVTMQFQAMLRDAEELGLSYLFDRMIIQVYNPLMFSTVDNVHHFKHYLYTLYTTGFTSTEDDFRTRAEFCVENGIQGITMWDYWWRDGFAPIAEEYGLLVFTHTVNDREEALTLLESGVSGIYTDSLAPADLAPPEEEPDGEETADAEEAPGGEETPDAPDAEEEPEAE